MVNFEIDRIAMPSPEEFRRRYVSRLEPVVITNLFEGQPIRSIRTRAQAIDAWGDMKIPLEDDYDSAIAIAQVQEQLRARVAAKGLSTDVASPGELTVREYFARLDARMPGSRPRVAFPAEAPLTTSFEVPAVCAPREEETRQFVSQSFIGDRDSFSQVHFDKAGLHGLLYQVYGRKRFIVFPFSATPKLVPFTQYGSWFIQNFSDDDRRAFLEFTGGREVVMEAGDAIFLPAFVWHFAYYLEDCWAVNLRFGRSDRVTELVNAFFPDVHMQALGAALYDPARSDAVHEAMKRALADTSLDSITDGIAKTRKLREIARALHAQIDPSFRPYAFDVEEFFPPPLPEFLDSTSEARPKFA